MEFFDTNLGDLSSSSSASALLVTVLLLVSLAFLLYMDQQGLGRRSIAQGPECRRTVRSASKSFADFGKFIMKEVVIPAGADKYVFMLAPLHDLSFWRRSHGWLCPLQMAG